MKTRYFSLALALATATLGAPVAQAATPVPPKAFGDVGVTMQSRVCGELMTSLALGGVQALKTQFPASKVPEAQRTAVYETGAQAVVLLTMSGSLSLEDRLKAGEIAGAIEKMDPQAHVDTARLCQRRVEAWIRAGEVKKDLVTQAYAQSKQLLDNAFSMGDDSEGQQ